MFSVEMLIASRMDKSKREAERYHPTLSGSSDSSMADDVSPAAKEGNYLLPRGISEKLQTNSSQVILVHICLAFGGVLLVVLVAICARGECALGRRTDPQTKRRYNTNTIVSQRRLVEWVGITVVIFGLTAVPFIFFEGYNAGTDPQLQILFLSGVFCLLSVIVGIYEVYLHLTNFHKPRLQRHLVKVLLMVPIYAIDAACTVKWPGLTETYLGALRSLWEALTIYSFYMFVYEYLQVQAVAQLIHDEMNPDLDSMRLSTSSHDDELPETGSGAGLATVGAEPSHRTASHQRKSSVDDSAEEYQAMLGDLRQGNESWATVRLVQKLQRTPAPSISSRHEDNVEKYGPAGAGQGLTDHIFPFNGFCGPKEKRSCRLKPWEGAKFLARCKHGVLQYVVLQVLCTVILVVTSRISCPKAPAHTMNCYNESNPNPKYAYFWTTLILNFSQAWALYCLMYCYSVTKVILRPIKPLGKFLCIKLVVFATFWQQLAFTIAGWADMLPAWTGMFVEATAGTGEDPKVLESNALQAALICLEMFFFSIAHRTVFSWRDYVLEDPDGTMTKRSRADALRYVFDGDLTDEFAYLVKAASREALADAEALPLVGGVVRITAGVTGGIVGGMARGGEGAISLIEDGIGAIGRIRRNSATSRGGTRPPPPRPLVDGSHILTGDGHVRRTSSRGSLSEGHAQL